MKYLLLPLLLLAGCDREVARVPQGAPVQREETISCQKLGYCYTCMPGFDGHMNCGLKMSAMCSGNQRALVEHQQYEIRYESGKNVIRDSRRIIKHLGMCQ